MAIINQSNILNLQPGITAPVVVHMSEGDSGTKLSFKLIDGARAWTDPGNVVAAVHGRRQDGTQFGPYACTISGDVVSFQTDAAIAAVAGSGIAQIVLTDGNGNTAGSANFAVMVERATFPMGVTYTNDKSVYEAILAYVQTIPAAVTEDYTTKIEAEAAAREAADASLQGQDASLQGQISAEASARSTQDAVLSARMDTFASLPSGSTSGNAELLDIRVKADSTTATTAGNAVREQITELKDSIRPITNTWESGSISSSTGADATSNKNLRTSNYLGTEINSITAKTGYIFRLAAYEADDTYVGMWNSTSAKFMQANVTLTSVDLKMIRNMFPTYKYRLDMKLSSDAAISLSESSNLVYDPSSDVGINSENIEKETQRAKTAESGLLKGGYVYHEIQGGLVVGTTKNGEPYHVSNTDMCTDRKQEFTEDCIITTDWSKYSVIISYFVQGEYDSYVVVRKDTALSANDVIRLAVRKKSGNLTDEDKADIVANTFYKTSSFLSNTIETVGDYAEVREAVIKADDFLVPIVFEAGNLNSSNGKEVDASDRVRTAGFLSEPGTYLLRPDGQNIYTYKYTSDGTFVNGVAPWGKKVDSLLTIEEGYKYRFVSTDTNDVTPANNKFKIYRRTVIKDIHDGIVYDNAYLSLPPYFVGNVQNGVARYKSIKNSIIGDSFCFLTDVHLNANNMHSGAILRYIGKNTDCKKVFCGGDVSMAYNASASVDFLKDYVEMWLANMRRFKGDMDYYGMRGNHDMYVYESSAMQTIYQLPYTGAYALICGANGENAIPGEYGAMYYYVDNPKEKIRYICCDTSDTSDTKEDSYDRMQLTEKQLQWVADSLMDLDDDWTAIVLGHISCSSEVAGYPTSAGHETIGTLGTILKDYKNKRISTYGDFTSAKADLVGYICGHSHTDQYAVDDGLLIICVTCDSRSQISREESEHNWTRTRGTVSEQCIDIFTIDTQNKKLYATRFGVGGYGDMVNGIASENDVYDRVWDY